MKQAEFVFIGTDFINVYNQSLKVPHCTPTLKSCCNKMISMKIELLVTDHNLQCRHHPGRIKREEFRTMSMRIRPIHPIDDVVVRHEGRTATPRLYRHGQTGRFRTMSS